MKLQTLNETQILITFIALALLILFAYTFGTLFEKIKGPRVVGEILGGMVLGGSCLFILFPDVMKSIFFAYNEEGQVLNIFYQLGLIFLMFLSGYNTDIKIDKNNSKVILLVFIGATVLPMLGALPFINMFKDSFIGSVNNDISFTLVFCIGVAYAANIINVEFFTVLILTTMLSSMMAGYFLRYQQKKNNKVFNTIS